MHAFFQPINLQIIIQIFLTLVLDIFWEGHWFLQAMKTWVHKFVIAKVK